MQVQRSSHIIDKGGEAQRGKVTQLPSGRSEMKVSPLSHYLTVLRVNLCVGQQLEGASL